ncbi:MAG TPA: hypothetical protein PKK10_06565 [Woeseiaceae bacterium]|nr:hypothetical protein [Woeseiaceae bacterium]
MDTGWVQVFILTIAECVAPAGKQVCQQSDYELQFLTQNDCEFALQELLTLKSASENVIVDRDRSGCAPSARQSEVFKDLAAVDSALAGQDGWRQPESTEAVPQKSTEKYEERLATLKSCEDTNGITPCKIGEIIIEGAAQQVDVWRSDR